MDWYLYVILVVKIVFLALFLKNKIHSTPESKKRLKQVDSIFMLLLCTLMVYLFHPGYKGSVCIDQETKLFLFLFAILTGIHTVSDLM
jgi:hypothetical protein